ncbi:HAMP domain-containing sensor histidine kinase [Ellagibacter isourolithinifaciens]|uniref:sensor histidine kinase n=1 Tax=Ellagibacter isourolithinifaciens TaxID=2137581 RepID=UPI002E7794F8|nr:HAMP domain-containing sensor histidine kinase [Ellagibacter isourolithinifaciens]MEE0247199.1 HAMP domain-containing sensor histidine kinase [Ellagibacter isourolithinifaciens]
MFTFGFSLLIGHFLSEPLTHLAAHLRDFRTGDPAPATVPIDGRIEEVDRLTVGVNRLSETIRTQQESLASRESRESTFVSDVAHELRTPLTAIRGNAEMLSDPDLPPAMREKFTGIIVEESRRLSNLVNDLLALQRLESGNIATEFARVDLGQVAREVVDSLSPLLREREANCQVIGEAPDVLGNRDRLKQVVFNLVENASRFIEPGGHITVELMGARGNSVLSVRDDGCGLGDADPKLLFDRFYRGDPSRNRGTGGTGLGLAIVKSVVDAHDGTVEAFNLPDGGACFLVAIPSIA